MVQLNSNEVQSGPEAWHEAMGDMHAVIRQGNPLTKLDRSKQDLQQRPQEALTKVDRDINERNEGVQRDVDQARRLLCELPFQLCDIEEGEPDTSAGDEDIDRIGADVVELAHAEDKVSDMVALAHSNIGVIREEVEQAEHHAEEHRTRLAQPAPAPTWMARWGRQIVRTVFAIVGFAVFLMLLDMAFA